MRSAVDSILKWHKAIHSPDLAHKLDKLTGSPFRFFRGTFFLYCQDLAGPFRKPKPLTAAGPMIGDLHTENYGTFRSVTGDIVYDINDFDETTESYYDYDIRRLAVSIILGALENGHSLGDGVNTAEAAVRSWLDGLRRRARLPRQRLIRSDIEGPAQRLLGRAGEASRVKFLRSIAEPDSELGFRITPSAEFPSATPEEAARIEESFPFFLEHCAAPRVARLARYRLVHVARRVAGNGSLGRARFALLIDNGKAKQPGWEQLRLVEFKQALDSSLDSARPRCKPRRARDVYRAALAFQAFPKRYLGYTKAAGMALQAREIGSNDARFKHTDFTDMARFEEACGMFGQILARCHLLAAPQEGPRAIPKLVRSREDRYVRSVLEFAVAYAGQVHADYDELKRRAGELATAWK